MTARVLAFPLGVRNGPFREARGSRTGRNGLAGNGTLVPYADRYITTRRQLGLIGDHRVRTLRGILGQFADCYGQRPVGRLGRSDVERWMSQTAGRLTPSTQSTRFTAVRGFTRWLVRERILIRDPCLDLRAPMVPRTVPVVFTADQMVRLLDVCPDDRARLIVLLMVQCGLRCVEVSRLQLGDMEREQIRVIGKGGHERVVYLPTELREAAEDYLALRGYCAGPLILNYRFPTRGLAPGTISVLVTGLARAAGLKRARYDGKSAHGLRRTAATDMLDHGAGIEQVAEALGHSDLASVRRYAKVNGTRLREVMGGRRYGRQIIAITETA